MGQIELLRQHVTNLDQILAEAAAWTDYKLQEGPLKYPGSWGVEDLGNYLGEEGKAIVGNAVEQRRDALKSAGILPKIHEKYPGELVLFSVGGNIYDGAGNSATEGFMGDDDIPASDAWIAYFPNSGLGKVLAYVPEKYIPLVQDAIDCSPCIPPKFVEGLEVNRKIVNPPVKIPDDLLYSE